NLRSGGFANTHFGWTYVIPVVAGLLLGRGGMLFYLLVQTTITLVFYQLWISGFDLPNVITPEHQQLLALSNRIAIVVTLSVIVLGFVLEREAIEAQLVKAKRQAEAGNRAKSDFLATVSHEIRTPLNGVLGMAELMNHTTLNQDQARYLNSIRNSSRSLLAVLNDVLDYSKIEAGKMQIEFLSFNLEQLICETVSLFALRSAQSGIELIVYIDPTLPTQISSDPTRIKQVLINLLGNAFKFTESGEVRLIVTRNAISDSESNIRFEVVDTGIGIPAHQQVHLFDSFSQLDASTTRKYGGSGLGLAICRRLLRLMGGEIGVESAENMGSTFWFSLPLNSEAQEEHAAVLKENLHGKRIVWADHSRIRAEYVQKALQYYGAHVEFAKSKESIKTRLLTQADHGLISAVVIESKFLGGFARYLDELVGLKDNRLPRFILIDELTTQQAGQRKNHEHFDYVIEKPVLMSVLLPLLLQAKADKQQVREPIEIQWPADMQILIVEDNEMNQAVIEGLLDLLRISHVLVKDGQEALDYLRNKPETFDMVFMDCEMPVLDGIEATRQIRALGCLDKHKKPLPIIALSAHAFAEKIRDAYEAGMDYFLTKPIEIDVIAKVITSVAKGQLAELKTGNSNDIH
ncbi:MAG TPA: ATP-binding protein, partial [Pseudomonadales bacterium]|nr:ATP-binding protein [Pseudomonadales bacterium]